ncbi:MAG: helix-turn-helix domain-containing protein [Lachnospiraceae bacterium]
MNLEIANRLVGLRKENKLSQEALAEKLGISRQAVSKWERAEASPDTDNLIALAKLYHVSLDELLKIHEEENELAEEEEQATTDLVLTGESAYRDGMEERADSDRTAYTEGRRREKNDQQAADDVHIGLNGIHVRDKKGEEVHISWNGIHVHSQEDEVHIDKNGIIVNGEKVQKHLFRHGDKEEFPLGLFSIVIYIVIGVFFDLWHPGWMLFLLVPVVSSLIQAVRCRNASLFAYPCLIVFLYLYMGFIHSMWHLAGLLFLTIPLYYSLAEYFGRNRRIEEEEQEQ